MRGKTLVAILALGMATALLGCEEEGPAERAGEQMDEAAEDIGGAFEELGREVGEAADETKDAADEVRRKATD